MTNWIMFLIFSIYFFFKLKHKRLFNDIKSNVRLFILFLSLSLSLSNDVKYNARLFLLFLSLSLSLSLSLCLL